MNGAFAFGAVRLYSPGANIGSGLGSGLGSCLIADSVSILLWTVLGFESNCSHSLLHAVSMKIELRIANIRNANFMIHLKRYYFLYAYLTRLLLGLKMQNP